MSRKIIRLAFGAVLFALCPSADAQQPRKVHRIGLLISAADVVAPFTDAFRQGMRELGYVEGKNYSIEIRGGVVNADRLFDWAAELVRLEVQVIVPVGSPALKAAAKATQ